MKKFLTYVPYGAVALFCCLTVLITSLDVNTIYQAYRFIFYDAAYFQQLSQISPFDITYAMGFTCLLGGTAYYMMAHIPEIHPVSRGIYVYRYKTRRRYFRQVVASTAKNGAMVCLVMLGVCLCVPLFNPNLTHAISAAQIGFLALFGLRFFLLVFAGGVLAAGLLLRVNGGVAFAQMAVCLIGIFLLDLFIPGFDAACFSQQLGPALIGTALNLLLAAASVMWFRAHLFGAEL